MNLLKSILKSKKNYFKYYSEYQSLIKYGHMIRYRHVDPTPYIEIDIEWLIYPYQFPKIFDKCLEDYKTIYKKHMWYLFKSYSLILKDENLNILPYDLKMLILSMINYPVDSIMYHCHNGVIKKNEFKF